MPRFRGIFSVSGVFPARVETVNNENRSLDCVMTWQKLFVNSLCTVPVASPFSLEACISLPYSPHNLVYRNQIQDFGTLMPAD